MACVVIYDSGVGGLSIYQEVISQCPEHDYIFVSDNQAFPYGTKAQGELVQRVLAVTEKIEQQYQPDILVVACNTASTVVLPLLRERFDFEIVGVVPAIKPAAQLSTSKTIGLLATPATIERDYTNTLIAEFAGDCEVISIGSSELVQIAEEKLCGRAVDKLRIVAILEPVLKNKQLDALVLACTHFPLLRPEIDEVLAESGRLISLVDSGAAIAKRVAQIIKIRETGAAADDVGVANESIAAFTQALDDSMIIDRPNLVETLKQRGFQAIEHLPVKN